jgi:hypothetical protein
MELAAGRSNVSEGSFMGRNAVKRGSSSLSALVRLILSRPLAPDSNPNTQLDQIHGHKYLIYH